MAYRETTKTITKKAEVKDNILLSARSLILQGGFRLATISAIAEGANIATGTVYRHFPSKSELFSEVFRAATALEVSKVAEAIDINASTTQRLTAAVNCFSKRALKAPQFAWALIAEPVDPTVDADRLHYRKAYADIFESLIEDGVRAGEIPPQNKNITAAALVGAMAESLVGPLSPSNNTTLSNTDKAALIHSIAQFCVQAVTGQEYSL